MATTATGSRKDRPAATSGTKPRRKLSKLGLWAGLVVVLAIAIASTTGWLGWGWAHVKALAFPRDESLLEYVPDTRSAVAVVNPHLFDQKVLGGDQEQLHKELERVRTELKKATGIDLLFDVDKVAIAPGLVVARGRFDEVGLVNKLVELHYVKGDYKGTILVARAGEDAVALVGDGIIVYGDEAGVHASIDAKSSGKSLGRDEKVTDRLREVGWGQAVIATARLTDDTPSLRSMIAGASGPRAVSAGVGTKEGVRVTVVVETASPAAATELAKRVEERRKSMLEPPKPPAEGAEPVADPTSVLGPELRPKLVDIAKATSVHVEHGDRVMANARIDTKTFEALVAAVSKTPLTGGAAGILKLLE